MVSRIVDPCPQARATPCLASSWSRSVATTTCKISNVIGGVDVEEFKRNIIRRLGGIATVQLGPLEL